MDACWRSNVASPPTSLPPGINEVFSSILIAFIKVLTSISIPEFGVNVISVRLWPTPVLLAPIVPNPVTGAFPVTTLPYSV